MSGETNMGYMGMSSIPSAGSDQAMVEPMAQPTNTSGIEAWGLRSDIAGLKHAIGLLTAFIREQVKNEREIISCMKGEQSKMDELKREIVELRKEMARMGRMK